MNRWVKWLFLSFVVFMISACVGEGTDDNSDNGSNHPPSTNTLPKVNAGVDKTTSVNTSITLTGTASDSDGSIVSYEWKKGSEVLGTSNSLTYTPTTSGTDTLTLTVMDDDGATASDSVDITSYERKF